jgi:hypothetical protein
MPPSPQLAVCRTSRTTQATVRQSNPYRILKPESIFRHKLYPDIVGGQVAQSVGGMAATHGLHVVFVLAMRLSHTACLGVARRQKCSSLRLCQLWCPVVKEEAFALSPSLMASGPMSSVLVQGA